LKIERVVDPCLGEVIPAGAEEPIAVIPGKGAAVFRRYACIGIFRYKGSGISKIF